MKTPTLTTLCLALAACGARGGVAGDAGDAGPEPALARRSFDVVASVTMMTFANAEMMPLTNRFTLLLDPEIGRAIAGGGGQARAVPLETDGRGTFSTSTMFGVGVSEAACAGLLTLFYDTVDVTVTGDKLVGRAKGHASFASPDSTPTTMPFEANLTGAPDTTAPFLIVPAGATTTDPLAEFEVWVSEPLPPTALARMVGGNGAVSGLVPLIIDGAVPLIASFGKPSLTLPPGVTFNALFSDDVIDLAGNVAPMGDSLRLTAVGPAPLVLPDGFEAATDQMVAGAAVVRSGPGIPIAGNASVYIGQASSPMPAGITLTPKLVVRMAVPPDATKLSFSYRELAFGNKTNLGAVQIGSVGRVPGPAAQIPTVAETQLVTWGAQTFDESSIATMNVPLPDDRGPEVVIVISAGALPCNRGFGSPGLLIDDLLID